MAEKTGVIYGINGPVIYLKNAPGFKMAEMVYVGEENLVGEVISLSGDMTTIQVYEETGGMKPGEIVRGTGDAMSITLGPGILNNIFDGIERPLSEIARESGKYIARGVQVSSLDESRKWKVTVKVKPGDEITGGCVIAECPETASITHRSMMTPLIGKAVVKSVAPDGNYTITDPIVTVTLPDGSER
ncbi:MAG: V-type ATP synthase subunit A, partial [Lachnospiraceae bacterium]|nr:V-type ATP synthase subunit A [Lachnospiraceae bacterium]